MSELLQELLNKRGITTEKDIEYFLNPSYEEHIHDPFLMKDMGKAVERILKAIENKEKIIFFTDYDCDGIPAGVVFHDFFKKIGYNNFENYIPHRHDEGFGLNLEAVEEFAKGGAKLLITADCGITDVEDVALANKLGIDVIITDHHLPGEKLPDAFAILDPKQEGCEYPEKMLCGSGVVYKLIQGILQKNRFGISDGWEKWLLDMVGMATLSDMVPLLGENRVFASYGLKVLRKSPRPGFQKLLRLAKADQRNLVEDDIGFTVAPRINAASRMGVPFDAFRLLSTQDEVEAGIIADHLNKINDERKGLVASMVKEIKKRIDAREVVMTKKVLVMGNPNWRPAILGLAANTLMREHGRPVFLWGREGGEVIKGSCRSGDVNLVSIMQAAAPDTFIDFGGHGMSGGFSVSHDRIHLLEDELERAYEKAVALIGFEKGDASSGYDIDKELLIDDVNWRTYETVNKLAPFGEGNRKPIFSFKNAYIKEAKRFGKEGGHLELTFENSQGKKIKAIKFFADDLPSLEKAKTGSTITLLANLEKSVFRNFPELRLRVVDII